MNGDKLYCQMVKQVFRKTELTVPYLFYKDEYGEEYTTTEADTKNYQLILNAYREKHLIPFTDEIVAMRKQYGLTAKKMSLLLGFGENQYRLYEGGEMPSLSNARMLSGIRDVDFFERMVDESGDLFSDKERCKIKKNIEVVRASSDAGRYDVIFRSHPKTRSRFNGYALPDVRKLGQMVTFFARNLNGVFETKLNKLLFYTDFLHYRHFTEGISGLRYKAITYGPVPVNYGTLYESLPGLHKDVVEVKGGYMGTVIYSDAAFCPEMFSDAEMKTMESVLEHFKDDTASGISRISHREKAWLANVTTRSVIDYSDAFELTVDYL